MVRGLQIFKDFFHKFQDQYVLIGGTASFIAMEEVGLDFRSTRDLDIVLSVELLDSDFVSTFWNFVEKGEYQNRQKSTGKELFYRFHSPKREEYPTMIELFSRIPNMIKLDDHKHLTPIPTDDSMASLSAILLDQDY